LFLQNLLKKLIDILKIDKVKTSVDENYATIIKIVLVVGGVIIIFIATIAFIVARNSAPTISLRNLNQETMIGKKNAKTDTKMLINNEFVYPPILSFDVSNDYVDLMPVKKFKIPAFKTTINKYDIILEDDIDDTLKFNFEKRGGN
jgi:hypothetical protein